MHVETVFYLLRRSFCAAMLLFLPIASAAIDSEKQKTAGIGHGIGAVVVWKIVSFADLQYQHTVSLHGRNHLLRETAGRIWIGTVPAARAAARTQRQKLRIKRPERLVHGVKMLLMLLLDGLNSLKIEAVFNRACRLDEKTGRVARQLCAALF